MRIISCVEVRSQEDADAMEAQRLKDRPAQIQYIHEGETDEMESENQSVTFRRNEPKVGRNDPCPCGADKKFKNCHGRLA